MPNQEVSPISVKPYVQSEKKVRSLNGRVNSIAQLKPANQSLVVPKVRQYSRHNFDTVPTNLLRNSGAKYRVNLDASAVNSIKSMTLKIDIAEGGTSSMTLCPAPYFFNEISIRANGGSGDVIQTFYNDSLMANYGLALKNSQKGVLNKAGISEQWYYEDSHVIPTSGTRTYYLPLIGAFTDNFNHGLPWANSKADLQFEFTPTSDPKVSGSGLVNCSGMSLIVETEGFESRHELARAKRSEQTIESASFLNPVPISTYSKTLSANSESTINLDNLSGKCAFLAVFIRSTGASNSGNGNMKYLPIGDSGSWDLQDSSSMSIYGRGVALTSDQWRNHIFPQHAPDSDFNNWRSVYFLPFCENMRQALAGVKNGFMEFNPNQTYRLAVVPGAAPTSEIHTLNCANAANDGGYYRLSVNGHLTAPLLFNANAAAIKNALEALPPFIQAKDGPCTVTSSGSLETDCTITFSTSDRPLPSSHLVQVISESLNDGGVAEYVSSSVSTKGVNGFTTGSYDVKIYAFMHREVHYHNGRISVSDE